MKVTVMDEGGEEETPEQSGSRCKEGDSDRGRRKGKSEGREALRLWGVNRALIHCWCERLEYHMFLRPLQAWDGMGWNAIELGGMGWDEMGCDEM